jgi:virginiamycin B lyase
MGRMPARLKFVMTALLLAGCTAQPVDGTASPSVASRAPASPALSSPSVQPTASVEPTESAQSAQPSPQAVVLTEFDVPGGAHPHDVSPDAADGGVWYTGQQNGTLGLLGPATGDVREIPLGAASSPHGVITGPDRAAWITDSGLNAIVRVDPMTEEVTSFPLPDSAANANLNTAVFDPDGILWFTGQSGFYGRLDPESGELSAYPAPRGRGPYGITATPSGEIYYASLAGNHIARIDPATAEARVIEPPTQGQGARRVWSDSNGIVWVSEWDAGQLGRYDPGTGDWEEWRLPGDAPQAYAVFVDDRDRVWLTDFGANAIVRFDPDTEAFDSFPIPTADAAVRQLHGPPGEVWGAESATDKLIRVTLDGQP